MPDTTIRTFDSFIVSKHDTEKRQMEMQWASYQDKRFFNDLSEFWDMPIPDLEEDTGIAAGCLAVRLRASRVVMPWKAYYRWLRQLSDAQLDSIIEALYEAAEKCYFEAVPATLCILNEIYHFLLWLPKDLKSRTSDNDNVKYIKNFYNRFKLNKDVTEEDLKYFDYYCGIYGFTAENSHNIMLEPQKEGLTQ